MEKLLSLAAASLLALPAFAQPAAFTQRAGAWWGDVANPDHNQLWMEVSGIVPDATVSGEIAFNLSCTTPATVNTLKLTAVVIQVDGDNVQAFYGTQAAALLGKTQTFSIDTQKFADGWHELRARCYGVETAAGAEHGKQTQVTAGHQLDFKNGNLATDSHSAVPNIVDSHAWYDTDAATGDVIHYVYVQLLNTHQLTDAPLRGTVPVTGRVSNAGATTIAHWVVKVDGVELVAFHDSVQLRTFMLDTTKLANGPHVLAFHGHGLARSGKQLAGQVEVPITVAN